MSSKFGWCMGPPGAVIKHDECKAIATYYDKAKPVQIKCGCDCHGKESDHDGDVVHARNDDEWESLSADTDVG